MKIAIDARFWSPENRGLSCYTRHLIEELQRIDRKNIYYLLLRSKDCASLSLSAPTFHKVKAEAHWYGVKEQWLIPKILGELKPDLTHFPHFNVPLLYNRLFITTIHDLILFAYPTKKATTLGPLAYGIKNQAYRLTISHALKKSRAVIAVSKSTARDIQKFFPRIEKSKIRVIYEGSGDGSNGYPLPAISSKNKFAPRDKRLKENSNAKPAYILYVGGAYPHKNLERLILAFEKVRQKNSQIGLVIAGGKDYFFNRLQILVEKHKIPGVVFAGFVPPGKSLETLYREAAFCIFPSLYEGFGLPPLEALKRGKLVLCNNGTCFPEILGDSVIYFNGRSVVDISDKIIHALNNLVKFQKKFLPKAKSTLRKYNWTRMARETLALYES